MAKKNTTEVTSAQTTAVGAPMDFSADAGMGMEGADKASFAIPFLTVLQGQSPQVETVDGAKPGLFINTITNELFKEVLVIPCAYQRRFIRWAPRATGGGYKGDYSPVDVETGAVAGMSMVDGSYWMDVPADAKSVRDAKGQPLFDRLEDTRNHFVLAKSASGAWQPALLSMSSTQIKKSKRWMSRINGLEMARPDGSTFVPPSFSHVYLLKSVKEENSKGAWWGIDIDMVGQVGDANAYTKAKAFHASVASGEVEVTHQEPAEPAEKDDRF